MIVGHSLLAFTVVGGVSLLLDLEGKEALQLGAIAAAFALLPDVDVFYALRGLEALFTSGLSGFVESFWMASSQTHRGFTHSVITGLLGSLFFAAYYRYKENRAFLVLGGMAVLVVLLLEGFLVAAVAVLYLVTGITATHIVLDFSIVKPNQLLYAVLFALLSHPFGDVFTGTPPDFLYPLDLQLITERIILWADPVLNLVAVLSIELLLAWTSMVVYTQMKGLRFRDYASSAAFTGILAAALAGVIEPPTVESAYQFVYPLIGTGFLVAGAVNVFRHRELRTDIEAVFSLTANLLIFVTIGVAAFTFGYLW